MFFFRIHQPPAALQVSGSVLDALPKVLCSSPAGRMTTPPIGEVLHLPGTRQVDHNSQRSTVGARRQLTPTRLQFCSRKTKKPKRSASGCTSGSPHSADMNPRGCHRTTMSTWAFSVFGKINEQKTKRLPCLLARSLSNPGGVSVITWDAKWVNLTSKSRIWS